MGFSERRPGLKLPAYPRYKPSGVEWLGDVPKHWTVVPFKHRCRRFAIYGANMSSDEYVPDGVRFLRTTDIDDLGQLQPEGVFIEPDQAREYLLKDQDILLSRSGTLGRAFIYYASIHPACAYAGYLVRFVPSERLNTRFLFHFTKSLPFADWLQTQIIASTIGNVNGQKYAQCPLPLPERSEQDSIAAFLDRETDRMERLVAKKRELIERLKEKRTALISRTVTHGLPPAAARAAGLPENPLLKPSGLEWLDDVPAHWQVLTLKRVAQISYGVGGEIDRGLDEGLRTISLPNIDIEGNLNLDDVPFAEVSDADKRVVLLRKGDLLFNWRNGSSNHLGKTAYFNSDGEYSHVSFLLRIRFEPDEHCSTFFRYLLAGYRVTGFFKHSKAGVNNTFNLSELSALPVMFPPRTEQLSIATFLDAETAKLDALTEKVSEAVERLQEYRTALITAAVTGKIDVRKAIAS